MDPVDFSNVAIEAIYQELGSYIVQAIGDDWQTAILYAEIEDEDSGLLYGRYTTESSKDFSLSFDADYTVYLAFEELRERFQKPGHALWKKAEFTLYRNGKFALNFEYPD